MANSLAVSIQCTDTAGATNHENIHPQKITFTVTTTGDDVITGTQNIGTSDESLAVGQVATLGVLMIKNLDSTNFVQLSSDAAPTNYAVRLNAGEAWIFRMGQVNTTVTLKADTAACDVQYWLWEA